MTEVQARVESFHREARDRKRGRVTWFAAVALAGMVLAGCGDSITAVHPDRIGWGVQVENSQTVTSSLGDEVTVSATAVNRMGTPLPNMGLTWEMIQNPGVVEELGQGRFRIVGNGVARLRISITDQPDRWGEAVFMVDQQGTEIVLTTDQIRMDALGVVVDTRPRLVDANGNEVSGANFEYWIVEPGIARVDAQGRVESVGSGETTLHVGVGTLERTFQVYVDANLESQFCLVPRGADDQLQRCGAHQASIQAPR